MTTTGWKPAFDAVLDGVTEGDMAARVPGVVAMVTDREANL